MTTENTKIVGILYAGTCMGKNSNSGLPEVKARIIPIHEGKRAEAESRCAAFNSSAKVGFSDRSGSLLNLKQLEDQEKKLAALGRADDVEQIQKAREGVLRHMQNTVKANPGMVASIH